MCFILFTLLLFIKKKKKKSDALRKISDVFQSLKQKKRSFQLANDQKKKKKTVKLKLL